MRNALLLGSLLIVRCIVPPLSLEGKVCQAGQCPNGLVCVYDSPTAPTGLCRAGGDRIEVTPLQMEALQAVVDAHPGNSTFLLPAGHFYRFSVVVPKTGDQFIGKGPWLDGGTVLFGSKKICTAPGECFRNDAGQFEADGVVTLDLRSLADLADPDRDTPKKGSCIVYPPGTAFPGPCDFPDHLYLDGVMVPRGMGTNAVKPCDLLAVPPAEAGLRFFCADYGTKTLYLSFDPAGHVVSYSGVGDSNGNLVTTNAFISRSPTTDERITDVTIGNLRVAQFANSDTRHGIGEGGNPVFGGGAIQASTRWTVGLGPAGGAKNVAVSENHGCAIAITGDRPVVQNTILENNGKAGYCGTNDNAVFAENWVLNNNLAGFDVSWGGGGGRFFGGTNLVISNSLFADNNGHGIALDTGESGFNVSGNTVLRNHRYLASGGGDGIRIEASCNGVVSGNTVLDNDRSGIDLLSTHSVVVSGNTAGGPRTIAVAATGRFDAYPNCGDISLARDNSVIGNTVWLDAGTAIFGIEGVRAPCDAGGCLGKNEFSGNQFRGGACDAPNWSEWDPVGRARDDVDFATWRSKYAHDLPDTDAGCQ